MAQLIDYIDESKNNDEDVVPFSKLSDLTKLYTERLQSLGVDSKSLLRSTTSKNRILVHFPDLESHNSGRETLLGFKEDIGPALQKACGEDYDRRFLHIQKAAKLIMEDIFSKTSEFEELFQPNVKTNQCHDRC